MKSRQLLICIATVVVFGIVRATPTPQPYTQAPPYTGPQIYYVNWADGQCKSGRVNTSFANPANYCLGQYGMQNTTDTNEVVSGYKYVCPAVAMSGSCANVQAFYGTGCTGGNSVTSQNLCNVCQGNPQGYNMISCDSAGNTVTASSNCDSTCKTCKNNTKVTVGQCTVSPGSDNKYSFKVMSIAPCTGSFIASISFIRKDGKPVADFSSACNVSSTIYTRTQYQPADACSNGFTVSCTAPPSSAPTPAPVYTPYQYTPSPMYTPPPYTMQPPTGPQLYYTWWSDVQCKSGKYVSSYYQPSNSCMTYYAGVTQDTNESITGMIYSCPAVSVGSSCFTAQTFQGSATCGGVANYTSQILCNICQGGQGGYNIVKCDAAGNSVTSSSACDSTCTVCKNVTKMTIGQCINMTGTSQGGPQGPMPTLVFVKLSAIGSCTSKYIAMITYVRKGPAASYAPGTVGSCNVSSSIYARTQYMEADRCNNGFTTSCNQPNGTSAATPQPSWYPYTPSPYSYNTPAPSSGSNVYIYQTKDTQCMFTPYNFSYAMAANICLPQAKSYTKDSNATISGMMYKCPESRIMGNCGMAVLYKDSACKGTLVSNSQKPCNICQGDNSGFSILRCGLTNQYVTFSQQCNSMCTSCSVNINMTIGACSPAGEGTFVMPLSVSPCTSQFIVQSTYVGTNSKCVADSTTTVRMTYIEANVCNFGTTFSCDSPFATPEPYPYEFTDSPGYPPYQYTPSPMYTPPPYTMQPPTGPQLYYTSWADMQCKSGKYVSSYNQPSNSCMTYVVGVTQDTNESITGMIYSCPAVSVGSSCFTAQTFQGSATCGGVANYTSQILCNICQGGQGGYNIVKCDAAGNSVTSSSACDSTCTVCKNVTKMTIGQCINMTGTSQGGPQGPMPTLVFVKLSAIGSCTSKYIAMITYVRKGPAASYAPGTVGSCNVSSSIYARTQYMEADRCNNGFTASCNQPNGTSAATPQPSWYPYTPSPYSQGGTPVPTRSTFPVSTPQPSPKVPTTPAPTASNAVYLWGTTDTKCQSLKHTYDQSAPTNVCSASATANVSGTMFVCPTGTFPGRCATVEAHTTSGCTDASPPPTVVPCGVCMGDETGLRIYRCADNNTVMTVSTGCNADCSICVTSLPYTSGKCTPVKPSTTKFVKLLSIANCTSKFVAMETYVRNVSTAKGTSCVSGKNVGPKRIILVADGQCGGSSVISCTPPPTAAPATMAPATAKPATTKLTAKPVAAPLSRPETALSFMKASV